MGHYHDILGIAENSSPLEIKAAYRRLAKRYHPDINSSANASQKFIEINEAYEVLLSESSSPHHSSDNSAYTTQNEYYEFLELLRKQAKEKARIRYEAYLKKQERYRESGIQDISLLLKYTGRILEPVAGLLLIAIPVIISFAENSVQPFLYLFFIWFIGVVLIFDTYSKRKNYFKLGKFYYSFKKILSIYKNTNSPSGENCFYCSGHKADSQPYIINLLKVNNIKLNNIGPLQHMAGYNRNNVEIKIPRSQKAFIIHSITTLIKLISIFTCLLFFPTDSIIWRFVFGAFTGFVVSSLLLAVTGTHSKNAYLLSYGILIKFFIWLIFITLCSQFNFKHFNITTIAYFKFAFVMMIFIDSILEQLIKIPGAQMFKPVLKRYSIIGDYFKHNYQFYLEVPLWTTIYPLIKWIF